MSNYPDLMDEARRQQERTAAELQESLKLQRDENGDTRIPIIGIKIPKALVPFAEIGYDTYISPFTAHVGQFSSKYATELAQKVVGPEKAKAFGTAAMVASSLALLLNKPVTKLARIGKKYYNEREAMFNEMRPVIEATGANPNTNTVMRVEFGAIYDRSIDAAKAMTPDLPMLAVQALMTYDENIVLSGGKGAAPAAGSSVAAAPSDAAKKGNWVGNTLGDLAEKMNKNQKSVSALTAAATKGLQSAIADEAKQKRDNKTPSAWLMIQNLRDEVAKQAIRDHASCGFAAKSIEDFTISPLDNEKIKSDQTLHDYVIEIFQQHERERGHGELKGNKLREIKEVTKIIAESLADGTLDSHALVNLVGDGKILSYIDQKRKIADVKTVQAEVDRLKPLMSTCSTIDPKEFFDRFEESAAMQETLKLRLKDMKGVEKDTFAALFSDSVLKAAGMTSQEDRANARKNAQKQMHKIVEKGFEELAARPREELLKLELKEEDIDLLIKAADEIQSGNKDAIKFVMQGPGRELIQNILGAAALQELAKDKDSWARRIGTNTSKSVAASGANKGKSSPVSTENAGKSESVSSENSGHSDVTDKSAPFADAEAKMLAHTDRTRAAASSEAHIGR